MMLELVTPWLRIGLGFAWAEFSIGFTILWEIGEVSLHVGPFYVWLGAGE